MKKLKLLVLLTVLFLSACFNQTQQKILEENILFNVKEKDMYIYKSIIETDAFEIEFNGNIEEKDIETDNIKFIVRENGKSRLLIAKQESMIKKNEPIFKLNKNFEVISFKYFSYQNLKKNINFNLEKKLLGDGNDDDIIDILDFNQFVKCFGTKNTDENYNLKYDIYPSEIVVGDGWNDIYNVSNPDGMINLADFTIFVKNFGKTKPKYGKNIEIIFNKFYWEDAYLVYAINDSEKWEEIKMQDSKLYSGFLGSQIFIDDTFEKMEYYFKNSNGDIHREGIYNFNVNKAGIYKIYNGVTFAYDVTDLKDSIKDFKIKEMNKTSVIFSFMGGETWEYGEIYRKEEDGDFVKFSDIRKTNTKIGDAILPNKNYSYKIKAFRGKEERKEEVESEIIEFKTENFELPKEGVFKIANSYGIGMDSWENIADGFFYITYEAAKASKMDIAIMAPPQLRYTPKLIASFEIEHERRGELHIEIIVGKTGSNRKVKNLNYGMIDGGEKSIKNEKISIDISEFLPIEDEDIKLRVYDSEIENHTGVIKYFSISELSENYGEIIKEYYSEDKNVQTVDRGFAILTIKNITIKNENNQNSFENYKKNNSSNFLNELSRNVTEKDIEERIKLGYYNKKNENSNSGFVFPTLEQWKKYVDSNEMKIIDVNKSNKLKRLSPETAIDHSKSIYFPPIGKQEGGSCTSWAIGYYMATFYNARFKNQDISKAYFINDFSDSFYSAPAKEYKNKIMSPYFLYNLVNEGEKENGSYYTENIKLCKEIGISNWEKMNSNRECSNWPNEEAWLDAPYNKCDYYNNTAYTMIVDSDEKIEILKEALRNGYLIAASVDARKFGEMTSNDVFTAEKYVYGSNISLQLNHAVTIVGFDDYFPIE